MKPDSSIQTKDEKILNMDRAAFWKYCRSAANGSLVRAKAKNFPHAIDAHFIDRLLVDQKWCCAVSDVPLRPPRGRNDPFAPSLDRIVPSLGYVPGNVRVVCNIVNKAMGDWGLDALLELITMLVKKPVTAMGHQ